MWRNIFQYFKFINKSYPIIISLAYSVALSAICLIFDNSNLPSNYLFSNENSIIIVLAGFIILILLALHLHFIDTLKIVSVNLIDVLSITIIICLIFYGSITYAFFQINLAKELVIFCTIGICATIIFFRARNLIKSLKKADEYQSNLVDLKDIYTGEITINEGKTIFLDEKDVDYDLLERQNVINLLYKTITESNPDKGFVISLEGKWGSGKTTIINIVKKNIVEFNEDIVIIDEFDPWSYSNQQSLFFNMFDIIIQKSGLKYSALSTKQMAENISGNIFGKKTSGILKNFFNQVDSSNILKNKINDYLKLCGKKVVFFIDNLDRAENENIILLFKLVSNVFDFERVTYVLSFDDGRVKNIFEKNLNIDYQYLKKIIQMQIHVPEVDKEILERLYTRCLYNILISYGESIESLKDYNYLISAISKQSIDIRDFKRFVNSAISIPFTHKSSLYKRDLLMIEYIRLNNLSLYQKIHKNRDYFISHDKSEESSFTIATNKQKFNNEAKDFFNKLFSKDNKNYIDLLETAFPYVKRYKDGKDLEYEGTALYSDHAYSEIAKKRKICSGKYFDLYFTYTENEFIFVGELVEEFIDNINKRIRKENGKDLFNKLLSSIHSSYQKELFERFQLYIDDLKEESAFLFTNILFDKINEIHDIPQFFSLSALKRVEIIIWELLQIINEDHYNELLKSINKEYRKLNNIRSILYWFKNDREDKNVPGRKEKFEDLYRYMGTRIINDSINLYNDLYYSPKNIFGLYSIYKDDVKKIKDYIQKIVNEKYIFRLIYDIMVVSIGSRITYSISEENINMLTTEKHIDSILKNTKPTSEDQEFILEVYKNYKNGTKDSWGEPGISVGKIREFNSKLI